MGYLDESNRSTAEGGPLRDIPRLNIPDPWPAPGERLPLDERKVETRLRPVHVVKETDGSYKIVLWSRVCDGKQLRQREARETIRDAAGGAAVAVGVGRLAHAVTGAPV